MTIEIASIFELLIPAFVLFVVIYYAVRLAIRHEREKERRDQSRS